MIPHELCVRIYELVSEFELCMQRYIYDQALFFFSFFWGVERDLSRFLFLDSSSGFLSSFEAD